MSDISLDGVCACSDGGTVPDVMIILHCSWKTVVRGYGNVGNKGCV